VDDQRKIIAAILTAAVAIADGGLPAQQSHAVVVGDFFRWKLARFSKDFLSRRLYRYEAESIHTLIDRRQTFTV
jgi:hypothetical protein